MATATAAVQKPIPKFPKNYFNSEYPAIVGKLIAGKPFTGMVVPDLRGVKDSPFLHPAIRQMIELGLPQGVYWTKSKDRLTQKQFAHELCHWQDQYAPLGQWYLISIIAEYLIYGYGNGPMEKQAKAAEKKGLDTPEKQAWYKQA